MAGLSVAWYAQERGMRVTVLERAGVAAGSSWGNAGWITPAMAIPLAEPAVLRYGLKAMLDPTAPLHVPLVADPQLWGFLTRFAARCTMRSWRATMASLVPINLAALAAYDEIERDPHMSARTVSGPILAAFRERDHAADLLREFEQVAEAGLEVGFEDLTGEEVRALLPVLSPQVQRGVRIDGQRFLNPGAYVEALADAVRARGGQVREGAQACRLRHGPGGIAVDIVGDTPVQGDAVVLATGAWLPELARQFGVTVPLRAGRGYSFSVPQPQEERLRIDTAVYFPYERVVCTPIAGRVRLGGTMEFKPVDDPLVPERIEAIVAAARPLVPGLDLDDRSDLWVGGRPVTVDGLPLVGPTDAPGVYVHGGHGMWGMCQGPATAKMLVEHMATGAVPDPIRPLAPTR